MLKKILILAGGRGTRMKHLTKDKPKVLIDVLGKPFLHYVLQRIDQAGFKEIIIVGGYKFKEMQKFLNKYKNKFNIKLINQYRKVGQDKYGTACALWAAREHIENQNFVAINGDDLFSPKDLNALAHKNDNFTYLGVLKHNHPERFGMLKSDKDNFVIEMIEKPIPGIEFDKNNPQENYISTGLYKFGPDLFLALDQIELSKRGEYEMPDALKILTQHRKVKIIPLKNEWKTISSPKNVKMLEKFLH